MSGVETHHDKPSHDNDMSRVSNDAILTYLIDDLKQPHTPEEREMIQGEINQRVIDILRPKDRTETE